MRSDDGSAIFPYTRIRGQVALVGVNTAVPTPPFLASGRIGADQLSRLETQLLALKRQCLFRIVLIHHPITDDACAERKHLSDRLQIGRAHVRTQSTNAHVECRLQLDKKKQNTTNTTTNST